MQAGLANAVARKTTVVNSNALESSVTAVVKVVVEGEDIVDAVLLWTEGSTSFLRELSRAVKDTLARTLPLSAQQVVLDLSKLMVKQRMPCTVNFTIIVLHYCCCC